MLTVLQHFQRRIQLLLSDKESALTAMIEQRFVLSTGYDNAIIQPEEWHLLVKPDMRVVLSIQGLDEFYKSRTEESEASDTETESIARSGLMKGAKAEDVEDVKGRKGLQYSIANRYTTEFYDVLEVGLGPGRFLHKTITDNPLPWKRTAFRDIPVLEEIRRVTRDSGRTERDGMKPCFTTSAPSTNQAGVFRFPTLANGSYDATKKPTKRGD